MNNMPHAMHTQAPTMERTQTHHEVMVVEFRTKMFIVLALSIPVLILSKTIQSWFGIEVPDFAFSTTLLVLFASGIVWYGGLPFFKGGLRDLKRGVLGMNVLVSLAVLSGYFYSLGTTFLFVAPDLYWEISTLVLFLLFGHWMEMRAVVGATGALQALVKLIPVTAHRLSGKDVDADVEDVPTVEIVVGDLLLVRPGERVALDGVVIDGETHVNESFLTGESTPLGKKVGDSVVGGALNESGSITIRVTRIGEETALAGIVRLIKQAQKSKPKTERLADRAAHYLTLIAIIVGMLTFGYWYGVAQAGIVFAMTLSITVLVIACPHALGLAIPMVTSIASSLAAKNGILLKDMHAIEGAKDIDYIVFDKTGTLTQGDFAVSDVVAVSDWDKDTIIKNVAAIELRSEHPIARGIVSYVKSFKVPFLRIEEFKSMKGLGVSASVSGDVVHIGNSALMEQIHVDTTSVKEVVDTFTAQGKTVVFVAVEHSIKGVVALSDTIRKESKEAVEALQAFGIQVAMITGDSEDVARFVAKELGIETYFAQVLPKDKSEKIALLQHEGHKVAMVGDGVNDAPALTQADIGIAIGAGTDVAVESAEVVLIKNDPRDIAKLINLSKKTVTKMVQNIAWATGYNIVAIPIAAGALFSYGVILRPEYAALIMATSSIIVVLNALMLARVRI